MDQQFRVLADVDRTSKLEKLKLADMGVLTDKTAHDAFVGVTAYLFIIGYVDPQLRFVKAIAGDTKETLEQQKRRLQRDSNQ